MSKPNSGTSKFKSQYTGGLQFALVEGSVHFVSDKIAPEHLSRHGDDPRR